MDHVYVIGESGLLNDEISDCKYLCYGTGKLLEDLMNFIDPNAIGCRRKVILLVMIPKWHQRQVHCLHLGQVILKLCMVMHCRLEYFS